MGSDRQEPPQQVQKAYVLGAGFSKPFGFPLLHDLFTEVLEFADSKRAEPFWNEFGGQLKQFICDLFPLCPLVPGHYPDIVEVTDMLQGLRDLNGVFEGSILPLKPEELLSSFRKALAVVFHRKLVEVAGKKPIGGRFFQSIEPGTVFVSLNWDNVLECGLYNAKKRFGFKYDEKKPDRILVIKPHGSIDWFRHSKEDEQKRYRDLYSPLSAPVQCRESQGDNDNHQYYLKRRVTLSRIRSIEHPDRALDVLSKALREPEVVTIGHGKADSIGSLDSRVEGMWKQAGAILPRAKEILIVGYSLPRDDVEMRLLLAHSMWRHKCDYGEFPSVTVVNPDASIYPRFAEAVGPDVNFVLHPFTP